MYSLQARNPDCWKEKVPNYSIIIFTMIDQSHCVLIRDQEVTTKGSNMICCVTNVISACGVSEQGHWDSDARGAGEGDE